MRELVDEDELEEEGESSSDNEASPPQKRRSDEDVEDLQAEVNQLQGQLQELKEANKNKRAANMRKFDSLQEDLKRMSLLANFKVEVVRNDLRKSWEREVACIEGMRKKIME